MDATFNTVWLSDVHLGSRACRVQLLLDFLRQTRCDTLYLVGDIIDLESLRESFFWPTTHTEVLRALLKKSQEGTRVVYIPGNHDDDMRALIGTRIGNVEVLGRCIQRPKRPAWTASSAGTFIRPSSSSATVWSTATTGIGSRAARRSSSARTARSIS